MPSKQSGPAGPAPLTSRKQRRALSWKPRLSHANGPVRALTNAVNSHPSQRHAIGVFDSGAGGLTVLDALRRRMPHRDFIYLGDTARVPYGRKPPEMVVTFAGEIVDFLCGLGVEAIVAACNTAS